MSQELADQPKEQLTGAKAARQDELQSVCTRIVEQIRLHIPVTHLVKTVKRCVRRVRFNDSMRAGGCQDPRDDVDHPLA